MYSARTTPAFVRYCERFQPGFLPTQRHPQPATTPTIPTDDDPNSIAWVDYARSRANALARSIGMTNLTHYWHVTGDNTTARQEAQYVDMFFALMQEHGDFDKALVAFEEAK